MTVRRGRQKLQPSTEVGRDPAATGIGQALKEIYPPDAAADAAFDALLARLGGEKAAKHH